MRKFSEKRQVWSVARLASGVATAGLAVGLWAGTAGAAGLDPVTDYASYPPALPAGCPGGESSVVGLQFDNGRGDTESDLRRLPLRSGDTLTMTWDGFAPGCEDQPVTLAIYSTHGESFDPHTDETLITHVSWTGGPFVLSVVVPAATGEICFLQVDAVLGAPLAVIGPNGTYYNSAIRGDGGPNALISAKNFAAECAEPAPEVPTTPPPAEPAPDSPPEVAPDASTPEAPPTEVEGTDTPPATTPAPSAPTTPPPASVEAEAVAEAETAAAPSTTVPEVEVLGEVVRRAPSSTLPRTGAATGVLAAVGAGLLAVGAGVRRFGRRYAES